MPNTKIVATLGPASDSPETVRRLLGAGVDVIRLNASHGTPEEHAARIHTVREASAQLARRVGILLDLQGPKIRLGKFEDGGCELKTGSTFLITAEPVTGTAQRASTSYRRFAQDVKPGDRVLLADGAVELRAVKSDSAGVQFEVVSGGSISDHKGINLPGVAVSVPSLTEKDRAHLSSGVAQGVDMVALSFVRTADDVRRLREEVAVLDSDLPIVAKIEKPQAWENIDAILGAADGVMVARGDLGVEMALEKVPFIEKSIIQSARKHNKFVITATQMLESMVESATPTRAEVSDVANAIYDGTDAVMLSAETSVGKHPVEAVGFMGRIAAEAERSLRAWGGLDPPQNQNPSPAEVVATAACHASRAAGAAAIVVFTTSGSSARLIARFRPIDPVYAITISEEVARRLTIIYGIVPVIAPEVRSTDEMLEQCDRLLVEKGYLTAGASIVLVAGQPIGRSGTTNLMKLHKIGELR